MTMMIMTMINDHDDDHQLSLLKDSPELNVMNQECFCVSQFDSLTHILCVRYLSWLPLKRLVKV